MSSGKWAIKDVELPKPHKNWKSGDMVQWKENGEICRGTIEFVYPRYVQIKTIYGYRTCVSRIDLDNFGRLLKNTEVHK